MQFTIPQHFQDQKAINLDRFPALGIDLTQEQIDQLVYGQKISGLTTHQKEACRILATQLNWHPMYIAECCPQDRPPLLCNDANEEQWETHCKKWQAEHDTPIEELVEIYKIEFARVADRLFEPLDRHSSGALMSAHDNTKEKYPCKIANW